MSSSAAVTFADEAENSASQTPSQQSHSHNSHHHHNPFRHHHADIDARSPPLPSSSPRSKDSPHTMMRTFSGEKRSPQIRAASTSANGTGSPGPNNNGSAFSGTSNNNNANSNNNVFGRVVRKLSKRVKPPGARNESETNEPPAYSAITNAGNDSSAGSSSSNVNTHRRGVSRDRFRNAQGSQRPERRPTRRPSFEWGPPPLSSDRPIEDPTPSPRAAAPTAAHQINAVAGRNYPVASRSVDSLLSLTNGADTPLMGTTAATRAQASAANASSKQVAPPSSPPGYSNKPVSPNLGHDAKKGKISSTARAKPATDAPVANVQSSNYSAGYWAPRAGTSMDVGFGSPGDLGETEESIRRQIKERAALVGRGPFWAVQRGWTKGVVTSRDEADKRTRNFPGPVVRYFEAEHLDEALAFVKAGSRPAQVADDDDEDSVIRRISQNATGLGRSVSLMERKSQHPAARSRHGRGVQQSMSDARAVTRPAPRPSAGAAGGMATIESVPESLPVSPSPSLMVDPMQETEGAPSTAAVSDSTATKIQPILYGNVGSRPGHGITMLPVSHLGSSITFYATILGFDLITRHGDQQALLAAPFARSDPSLCLRARTSSPTLSLSSCTHVLLPLSGTSSAAVLSTAKSRFEDHLSIQRARIEAATVEGQQDISAYLVRTDYQWGQARVLGSVEEKPWGARELSLVDPDGHVLVLSSDMTSPLPGVVNGAGSAPAQFGEWAAVKDDQVQRSANPFRS